MSDKNRVFPMRGLEPDNLLAFLAAVGLLKSLEKFDPSLEPHLSWRGPGLLAHLHVARSMTASELVGKINEGLLAAASTYEFVAEHKNISFSQEQFRELALKAQGDLENAHAVGTLASDAVTKRNSHDVAPTPLCAIFGQGHQHFLERLHTIPNVNDDAKTELEATLFSPWEYGGDHRLAFRWDPNEDRRHAYQFGNPSETRHRFGSQLGANRLAAIGFQALPTAPAFGELQALSVSAGRGDRYVCWPLTDVPTTLAAWLSLLDHPALYSQSEAVSLRCYGVVAVCRARRHQSGKYFNFERARVQSLVV